MTGPGVPEELLRKVRLLREELHRCAEPSLREERTREILKRFLREHTDLTLVDRGLWFYAVYEGDPEAGTLAFRADFDGVEGPDHRTHHRCGHDGHAAALAGFGCLLSRKKTCRKRVILIFQPGEETGEGADLCILPEELRPDRIYAFHNIPGYPAGEILLRRGTFACASTGLSMTFSGSPAHAAYPETGRNPASAVAEVITFMGRRVKAETRGMILGTVIGVDLGSSAYGMSASKGILRVTVRGELGEEFSALVRDLTETAERLSRRDGLEFSVRKVEPFPATENDPEAVEELERAALRAGLTVRERREPFRWSEDFGSFLRRYSGAMFGVGAGTDHPDLHTEGYLFPDEILEPVIRLYDSLAEDLR